MTAAFLPGFLLGLSLIVAIGAQNACVPRQEHVFAICAVCAGSDAVLIAAGKAGCGAIVTAMPWLARVMSGPKNVPGRASDNLRLIPFNQTAGRKSGGL